MDCFPTPPATFVEISIEVGPLSGSHYGVTWAIIDQSSSTIVASTQIEAPLGFNNNYGGLWWAAGGSESGWGINLAHQGDAIFATWLTYDALGKAWWLSATLNKFAEGAYLGVLNQTTGSPFNAFVPPAAVTRVGFGTLAFTGPRTGTFTYLVNGVTQSKKIELQVFGPLPMCRWGAQPDLTKATNYQDMWWAADGAEPGWGVSLAHQGTAIFATWFTYDVTRNPIWYSAAATQSAAKTYTGLLYRTTGPPFSWEVYFPTTVVRTPVGTATFTFSDGNNGSFAYQVNDGANVGAQTKSITRQVFRPPGTICQ